VSSMAYAECSPRFDGLLGFEAYYANFTCCADFY
jgi:hypothetical protein